MRSDFKSLQCRLRAAPHYGEGLTLKRRRRASLGEQRPPFPRSSERSALGLPFSYRCSPPTVALLSGSATAAGRGPTALGAVTARSRSLRWASVRFRVARVLPTGSGFISGLGHRTQSRGQCVSVLRTGSTRAHKLPERDAPFSASRCGPRTRDYPKRTCTQSCHPDFLPAPRGRVTSPVHVTGQGQHSERTRFLHMTPIFCFKGSGSCFPRLRFTELCLGPRFSAGDTRWAQPPPSLPWLCHPQDGG